MVHNQVGSVIGTYVTCVGKSSPFLGSLNRRGGRNFCDTITISLTRIGVPGIFAGDSSWENSASWNDMKPWALVLAILIQQFPPVELQLGNAVAGRQISTGLLHLKLQVQKLPQRKPISTKGKISKHWSWPR